MSFELLKGLRTFQIRFLTVKKNAHTFLENAKFEGNIYR